MQWYVLSNVPFVSFDSVANTHPQDASRRVSQPTNALTVAFRVVDRGPAAMERIHVRDVETRAPTV